MQEDIEINTILPCDVYTFIQLCALIDSESNNMLYERGERKSLQERQMQQILNIIEDEKSTIWIARNKNQDMIGYLMCIGNNLIKTKHSAYLVIGVVKQYINKGIGTKLFEKLNEWRIENKLHRLELTVRANNTIAINFYSKMGFIEEGIKKHSLLIGATYEDEICMAKIFS